MISPKWVTGFSTLVLTSLTAVAGPLLTVHKSDGTVEQIEIESIEKITFDLSVNTESKQRNLPKLKTIASAIKTNTFFTDISYSLEKPGQVAVSVFTLNGKKIRTIRNGRETTGNHRCRWDHRGETGEKVPNGSYIIRVEIDGMPYSRSLYIVQ